MQNRKMRAVGVSALTLLASSTGLVCSSVRPSVTSPPAPGASLLTRTAADSEAPLAFPPADDARHPRPPMPDEYSELGVPTDPRVTEPALDATGFFKLSGRTLQITFDRPMAVPASEHGKTPAAPGTVVFDPDVPHTAQWSDARTLVIEATKPLDEKTRYTVALAGLKSAKGMLLAAWRASFDAVPRVVIAGKSIGYVPVPGEPRVIAVHPSAGAHIGRRAVFAALYDQPIDLPLARTLVHFTRRGASVPFNVEHPAKPTFQGVKVDPRFVVIVRPQAPLAASEHVAFGAKDHAGTDHEEVYDVADRLENTDVTCGWGEDCAFSHGVLRSDPSNTRVVHVLFNNPIAGFDKDLAAHVQVSPPVRNLVVRNESWSDGRVVLEGAFQPSMRYAITVGGLADRYGGRLASPVSFALETSALPASLAMPEGLVMLDEATTKRFAITTRNVAEATLEAWALPSTDATAFQEALERVRIHSEPDGNPQVRVAVPVTAARDRLVETLVDLTGKLAAGQSYVVRLSAKTLAHDAKMRSEGTSELPMALLGAGSASALAVHTRAFTNGLLVHVARLASGEPVAGASLVYGGADAKTAILTGPLGVALLPVSDSGAHVLEVRAGDASRMVPLEGEGKSAKDLFPDLASGAEPSPSSIRALVQTDRGIYRPGATVWIKAAARRAEGDRLVPAAGATARLRIVGPTGDEVLAQAITMGDMGSAATKLDVPSDAKLGRYQIRLEDLAHGDPPLGRTMVQVAEFEAPRFAVDVDTSDATESAGPASKGPPVDHFRAVVRGRYLFGSPMEGASVSYTLKRRPAPFPSGPLTDRGLVFRKRRSWSEADAETPWSRSGEGTLRADGTLAIEQVVPLDADLGPQEIQLEADVSDSSMRHVAARAAAVRNPVSRYAGVRVARSWVGVGEAVPVELGVIDATGQPIAGIPVVARLDRIEYRPVERRGPGGAHHVEWTAQRSEIARCRVESARTPASCSLTPPRSGDYEIASEIGGKRGGSVLVWAYRDGDDDATPSPTRGSTLDIVADKPRYAPGDRAKLLVKNPYPAATAIVTTEQGGLVDQRAMRVKHGAAVIEVPLSAASAPHVHATITLLPIGAKGEAIASHRIGAIRLPVALDDARLEMALRTDRGSYRPGDEAEIAVEVKDHGKPEARAEIALAVVDEGVLRLTDFHAPDPIAALRPGRALDFHLYDTRKALADLFEKSHVPGDGGGEGGMTTVASTRKNFVETALWRPDLRTDAAGRATVRFKLPDNLTQFRIMAVALDDEGKGASIESAFTVSKPVMVVPVVPRFAAVGDRFEVAAMVHNESGAPLAATVALGAAKSSVTISAGGQARVGFPFTADAEGERVLAFAVAGADGKVLDRVEARLRVDEPGLDERPAVAGAFARSQKIALAVPADARAHGSESITVQVGQTLWPELGSRLEYLLDYPHGCVEQTTSSTLPLLAARTILPRIGVRAMSRTELDKRIVAGLARLATMRTSSGGLAYWPGGAEPNVFGTAYAMRAVVLAQKAGIEAPRGLAEGMASYLEAQLLAQKAGPEVRAAIAQSLGEIGKLPASATDALEDVGKESSVFGQASLAIALGALGGQDDRVTTLLDSIEASFDDQGKLLKAPKHDDFYYYGSPGRTRAQAAIALTRLRRGSKLLPTLLRDLAEETDAYTTQATAFSLLALAEHLEETASEGAPARVTLDGRPLEPSRDLGFGSKEYAIPLASVRGRAATLELAGDGGAAYGFMVNARWRRPAAAAGSRAQTSTASGPSVYRVFTDAKGAPIDLAHVHAGDVVRVAVMASMPEGVDAHRRGYLAITDRLPAGFEPVQPDLATVASVPEIDGRHPFAWLLRGWGSSASHVELHDDRVDLYFDRIERDEVAASYLVRASTPGDFALPPASAELMYEPDSLGYSEGGRVVVR